MINTNPSYPNIDEVSKFLSPSAPIKSMEFLEGRLNELEKIDDILSLGGRSAFIVGDRGVGKTSLAQTASIMHTNSKYEYIYSACDPKPYGTFGKVMKDMLIKLAQLVAQFHKNSIETKSGLSLVLSTNPSVKFSREWSKSKSSHDIKEPEGASDVVRYLIGFGKILKESLCIVLDELENLEGEECKANLAHLIKQIGDQDIPFKFVFSGIGGTPAGLIGLHESTSRYYGAIPLEPLKAQPIIDIVKKPIKHFGLSMPKNQFYRIYTISCGFPHYPHLIGSKLIIHMLKNNLKNSTPDVFLIALNKAVEDSQPFLIEKYNKATMNRSDKVKYILWSFADNRSIDQKGMDVFESFLQLQSKFRNKIQKLKKNQFSASLPYYTRSEFGQIFVVFHVISP